MYDVTPRAPLLAAAVLLAAASLAVAGADTPSQQPVGGAVLAVPHSLAVALTPAGCSPTHLSVPAGPVTVTASNTDSPASSEIGLLAAGRQLAEAEGVDVGLTGSFAVSLAPGSYQLTCQVALGKTPVLTQLTVTAPQTRTLTPAQQQTHVMLAQASADYDAFVRRETQALVTTARTFDDAVRAGRVAGAKADYAVARVHYERIEPVAESFGALDALIDGRIDGVAPGQTWTGFHQIEHSLWVKNVLTGERPIAAELDLTLANLQVLVNREVDQPAQLADGAASLLDEVGATKITGEEERYSHLDAVDLVANVLGARTAVEDLMPALRRLDPALATTVADRFAAMQTVVDAIPAAVTADWTRAGAALRAQLSGVVDAAAEPLAAVAAEVAAA